MRAGDADRVQVLDVAQPRLPLDQLDLGAVLRGVGVNEYAALARERRDPTQKPLGATDGEARGEAAAHAPAVAPVPLFEQGERLADRVVGLLAQACGDALALVHHALPDRRAEPRLLDCAEGLFGVPDRLHREGAGRAAADHLGDAETGRGPDGARVVRGLQRPHAPLEPVD